MFLSRVFGMKMSELPHLTALAINCHIFYSSVEYKVSSASFSSETENGVCNCFPGRTFLAKRRYFSGIAALTPLTPLTYKQNAVNAFIPTKNAVNAFIPTTNTVNAVIPEKTCVYKKLIFSLHEEWETHSQSFNWQKIAKLLEHISSQVWVNGRGPESGPAPGGIDSVIELATAKQVCKKVHFTTRLIGVLQKFWQF